jgi:hypothetical protein
MVVNLVLHQITEATEQNEAYSGQSDSRHVPHYRSERSTDKRHNNVGHRNVESERHGKQTPHVHKAVDSRDVEEMIKESVAESASVEYGESLHIVHE